MQQLVSLDALNADWRDALDAAQDALQATTSCPTHLLTAEELRERGTRLTQDRSAVAQLLDRVARDEHVRLLHRLTAPRATKRMLGLPAAVQACVFDLDGVLTSSADGHAAAWADTFDELLSRRLERAGVHFSHYARFSRRADYDEHIDGKPRLDGVRAFLASRGIILPEGEPGDPPRAETVYGLANRKNEALLRRLDRQGVAAFEGSRRYLEAAREAGLPCAVVSASANTSRILERAGLTSLIGERIDGNAIDAERLRAKPAPDTLLAVCRRLAVQPQQAAVFETTRAGVAAARTAGFDLVVGVDRSGGADKLLAQGADVVVTDLAELIRPELTG